MTTAIVLAGGLGSRLRAAVPDLPKPMAPVGGRPFLEHLLAHWARQGVDRFVLSVGWRREAIVGHFGDSFRGVPITYSVETEPLGTGGALLAAAAGLDPDRRFLLLNGDTWFDVPLTRMIAYAKAHDTDWCFALFRAQERGRYMAPHVGVDGWIDALADDDERPGRLANGGVYLVHPRSLAGPRTQRSGPVSLESDLLPGWLTAGQRFRGLASDGAFVDIGVPEDWRRAARVIAPPPADSPSEGALARLRRNVAASVAAQQRMLADSATMSAFDAAVRTVVARYRAGGRLYVAGNGGSAADAQHLAAEFVGRLAHDRAPLPAEALTTDSSILTAIGNDYGFERVFERQLAGKAGPRDVFLGITTSGESPNILRALEHCRRAGLPSVVFAGRDGGRARALADHCVAVPGDATSTIQELHIVLAHTLCECVEAALFERATHESPRTTTCPATSS